MVFNDLVDSTSLLARLGDDRMDRLRRAHMDDVAEAVGSAGGRVVKTLGDGAMASFESALGALNAAAAIQAAAERLDAEQGGIGVAASVGVAAGEPIADGEDLHGMPVVIASRLSATAGAGEVLVQDVVGSLVASRDGMTLKEAREYELRGVPDPVRASRLLWRELAPADGEDAEGPAKTADRGQERAGATAEPSEAEDGAAPHIPLPRQLAAYVEEPLIGRDREIALLREETEPRPGARAALILGEPGIGKTRHAAAAAAEAHAGGATVVLARCPPEAVVPFEPWVRAIGELANAGGDAWRETLAGAAGPELAALVPELDRPAESGERVKAGEMVAAEGARNRLLRGIGAALACATGELPLHVVLDDAQWCDPASAQALAHLLEAAPVAELVLVATAREGEMGRRHPVSRVLSDLRRTGDLSELRLAGLDPGGMAQLVGARVGRAITPDLARRLASRTSGNPFFAGELARDLDAQGALREEAALDAAPVPEAVTGLVEERLGRLDASTERLLGAVAAIGPAAPVALAAKAAGLDADEAERAAGQALSERLVEDVAAGEPTVAFTHALVREALIADTGEAARARLHLAISGALEEEADAEPAELARHYGLAVELAGAEPAIAAHRAAAAAAAEGHDHEGAASHLRQLLALLPEGEPAERAPTLLELGEQELLAADLVRARESFRGAVEASHETGDAPTLARAALGFAGGDVGFGWEMGTDEPESVALLREGIEGLGENEPRLALRMTFRLAYLMIYSDDGEGLAALSQRAGELERRLGDAEAQVLARFTALVARFARHPDSAGAAGVLADVRDAVDLLEPAEKCGREDLLFRVVQLAAAIDYLMARIPECEAAIERAAEIAGRLGSPRFAWEVDMNRGMRLLDRGERAAGEALIRRGGATLRRLRPDLHVSGEGILMANAEWIYGGETATLRLLFEAMEEAVPTALTLTGCAATAAWDGDLDAARRRLGSVLGDDPEVLRQGPDGHLPLTLSMLAYTAFLAGDREAGERLRPLLEPLRGHLAVALPALLFGHPPELYIGLLELLAGRPEAAVSEIREAVSGADACELCWASAWTRVELAMALHRAGAGEEAETSLAEGESLAERYGVGWAARRAAEVRAEIEGRELPAPPATAGRTRPFRALASRGGRRALAATARDLDDAGLERRFAEPRRQRSLMRGLARGFQPARAGGFSGTVAWELEPFAIEPPPDSPWRWAIEAESAGGRARLIEPAPLDAAVTIRIGLADWVRVVAGLENPLAIMVTGRCRVEGDVLLAVRLEAMFGGA